MEALKNTSMMLILAAVFYGAYQMFVSDPSSWQDSAETTGQEQVLHQGQEAKVPSSLTAQYSQTQAQTPPNQNPNAGIGAGQVAATPLAKTTAPQVAPQQNPQRSLPGINQNFGSQNIDAQNTSVPNFGTPNLNASNVGSTNNPGISNLAAPNQGVNDTPAQNQRNAVYLSNNAAGAGEGLKQVGYLDGQTSPGLTGFENQPNNNFGAPAVQQPSSEQVQTKAALAAEMQAASAEIQAGKLGSALHRLSGFYDKPLDPADRKVLIGWLDNLAGEVVYSTKHALTEAYQVQPGDTLGSVAARHQIAPQLLANINFYGQKVADNSPLQPGSQLKVVPGPFRAVVDMKNRELTVFVGPLYAGRFNFETGDSAPERSTSNTISYVSISGIPAQDAQQKHEALSPGNPFGKYCLVVGDEVVMHSPGNNPIGSCLQFQETDMQNLQSLLTKGCHVQVIR